MFSSPQFTILDSFGLSGSTELGSETSTEMSSIKYCSLFSVRSLSSCYANGRTFIAVFFQLNKKNKYVDRRVWSRWSQLLEYSDTDFISHYEDTFADLQLLFTVYFFPQ